MIDRLLSPRLLRPLFWGMAAFALVMAALPQPPSVPMVDVGDKVQHMLAFAALTLVARLAWPRRPIWQLMAWLVLFGAGIELLQAVPALHRDSDWHDLLADSIAIAFTALVAQYLVRFLPQSETT